MRACVLHVTQSFGTRNAMRAYLNRVDLLDLNFSAVPRNGKAQASTWSCHNGGGGTQPKSVCTPKRLVDVAHECKKKAGCMISLNSERFAAFALYRANLTVVRMRWAFCKFGNSSHAWHTCTRRLRSQTPCKSFSCPSWMAGGCKCSNSTCAPNSWYCVGVPPGTSHGIYN
jgi:hypothetical protein